jgi:Uma2 family endonuclease
LGLFLGDGLFWSNVQADVGGKPDATFASNEAFRSNRVRLIEGKDEGYVELEGSPNVVIEVVSRSSVHKDKVLLRKAYWEAEVREYWIVDARKKPLTFDVLRHTAKGYRATPLRDGWLKSIVFGKSFRFTQQTTALGHPGYTLAVR